MKEFEQKENETRKDFLIRIAIYVLRKNAFTINEVRYDDAICDAACLAEDLEIELNPF